MFTHQITIFRILGFKIRLDASWVLLALLVTWTLAAIVFPDYLEGAQPYVYWMMGAIGALLLFISIILHELAHSVVARVFGIPINAITLFIFGGVAEMEKQPPTARSEFWMAIAGPVASFFIALLLFGASVGLHAAQTAEPARIVLSHLAFLNLILAVFNCIPAFPLDGGRVLRSILWAWSGRLPWSTRIAAALGSFFGIGIIVLGVLGLMSGAFIGGIWFIMIGLFMRNASQMSYKQVLIRRALSGMPVREFMKDNPVTIVPHAGLHELVEHFIYKYHFRMYPVVQDGVLLGAVDSRDARNVPREDWHRTIVREIMQPRSELNTVTPETDATDALSLMHRTGNSRLLVVDGDQLVGVLTLKDLLAFLSYKMDFGDLEEAAESR